MKKIAFILLVVALVSIGFYHQSSSQENSQLNPQDQITEVSPQVKQTETEPQIDLEVFQSVILKSQYSSKIAADCEHFLTPVADMPLWIEEKKAEIEEFYLQLIRDDVDSVLIDHISELSGVNFLRGRLLSGHSGYSASGLPATAGKDANKMSNIENQLFQSLLKSEQWGELFAAYQQGKLSLTNYPFSFQGILSPISFILKKNSAFQGQDVVLRLIASGLKPTFIDLVTATELALPVNFVAQLYNASEQDATRTYIDIGFYESLSIVATKSLAPELLEYWLSLDSPATPDFFTNNALDYLAVPESSEQREILTEMFIILMRYQVKPNSVLTENKLRDWLPKQLISDYQNFFTEVNDKNAPKDKQAFIINKVTQLYQIMLKDRLVKLGTDKVENECFIYSGYKAIKTIFRKKHRTAINKSTTQVSADKKARELVASFDRDSLTTNEIIEQLSERDDLVAKLAMQQLMLAEMQKKSEMVEDESKQKLSQQQNETINEAIASAGNNNWEVTQEIIDNMEDTKESERLDLQLMLAISSNQDWSVIRSLLEAGAVLPEVYVFILARLNNPELAERLIPYGLDIHLVDSNGYNAIYHSAINNAQEMLVYLLDNHVDINVIPRGMDALDHALSMLRYRQEFIGVIEVLVKRGMKIVKSHRERVEEYKNSSPGTYQLIATRVPQLINSTSE